VDGELEAPTVAGTDVDTGGSSRIKRPLSPGGTPQDAQSQVKHTTQKRKKAPYNSQRTPEVFNILTEVFIVPWLYWGMDYGPICGLVLRRTTSPPPKLEVDWTWGPADCTSLQSIQAIDSTGTAYQI